MIRIPLNVLLDEDDKDYRFLFEQAFEGNTDCFSPHYF